MAVEEKIEGKVEETQGRSIEDIMSDIEKLPGATGGDIVFQQDHDEKVEAENTKSEPEKKEEVKPDEGTEKKEEEKSDPEKKPDEAGKTEPEKKSEEDEGKPGNKEAAELRVQRRKDRERIDALEEEIRGLKESTKQPEKPKPDDVFLWLAKAEEGELNNYDGQNEEVRRQALDLIHNALNADEVQSVLQKANSGQYGDYSKIIAEHALKSLGSISVRESRNSEQKKVAQEKATRVYKEELDRVLEEMPDFGNKESALNKHIDVWKKEWLGDVDDKGMPTGSGILPKEYVHAIVARPFIQAKLIELSHRASTATSLKQTVDKLNVEIAVLKEKLASLGINHAKSSPPAGGDKVRTAEDIKSDLARLSSN